MELSDKEEEEIVTRIALRQEEVVRLAFEWSKKFGVDAPEIHSYVVLVSVRWKDFICSLMGVSPERYHEVLDRLGI